MGRDIGGQLLNMPINCGIGHQLRNWRQNGGKLATHHTLKRVQRHIRSKLRTEMKWAQRCNDTVHRREHPANERLRAVQSLRAPQQCIIPQNIALNLTLSWPCHLLCKLIARDGHDTVVNWGNALRMNCATLAGCVSTRLFEIYHLKHGQAKWVNNL